MHTVCNCSHATVHNGIILLEKLYLRVIYVYRIESEIDEEYAGELSYHNLFAYVCQLTNRLSHYHTCYLRTCTPQSFLP